jgi:hypothetical protein
MKENHCTPCLLPVLCPSLVYPVVFIGFQPVLVVSRDVACVLARRSHSGHGERLLAMLEVVWEWWRDGCHLKG